MPIKNATVSDAKVKPTKQWDAVFTLVASEQKRTVEDYLLLDEFAPSIVQLAFPDERIPSKRIDLFISITSARRYTLIYPEHTNRVLPR